MHCHSMVNARDCTLRPKWQCPLHCHSASSVPRRCAQARVAVPTMRDCTLRAEWQCRPRGAARSGPSGSANRTGLHAQGRVAVPLTLPLDVERTETVRSGPSGSAGHAGLHAQARVAVPLTLPLDVERTETARSSPSGSANRTGLHAQGRVAVPLTLPLDGERTGCTPSHCHSTSSVPRRRARARVAVPTTRGCTLRPEWQCGFGWPTSQQSLRRCQGAPPGRVSGERVLSLVRDGPFAGSGTSSCKAGRDGCAAGQPDVVSLPQGGTAAPSLHDTPC